MPTDQSTLRNDGKNVRQLSPVEMIPEAFLPTDIIPSTHSTRGHGVVVSSYQPPLSDNIKVAQEKSSAISRNGDRPFYGTSFSNSESNEGSKKPQSAPASVSWGRGWTDQESNENSERKSKSSGWRKFCQSAFGHAPQIGKLIAGLEAETKRKNKWLLFVVNVLHSILLSISSTAFVSNPLSGLIILSTMFIGSAEKVAILGLVCLFFGILASIWPLGLPTHVIIGGSITFNCFLLGSTLLPLAGVEDEGTVSWLDVFGFIPLAAGLGLFVVYLWSGFNGILNRGDLPVLNAPTNILALLLLYSGYLAQFHLQELKNSQLPHIQQTVQVETNILQMSMSSSQNGKSNLLSLNGSQTLISPSKSNSVFIPSSCDCSITDQLYDGIILSLGIIFQVDIPYAYFIYLSVLIFDFYLFCQDIFGALIGTIIGMALEGPCGVSISNGSWGYNSLLTCGALGGIFIRYNFHSFLLSLMGAVLSGFLCAVFKKNGIPILGLPFMIATWLLIPLATTFPVSEDGPTTKKLSCLDLQRVVEFSTPELNSICRIRLYSRKKYVTQKSPSILHI